MKTFFALVAAAALIGCNDPTAPGFLAGRWAAPYASIGSDFARDEQLTFRPDGILEHRMRIYRSGRLESTHEFTYTYVVRNDSLFTSTPGAGPANWTGTRFDRGKLQLDRSTLTITYPWFGPADESITVTQVFYRLPCQFMMNSCR
ncbi:MAG TPA: hypothetical protein VEB19_19195 [Gemmatimonadaceae bacterium]|nr:hypothetical protein [Gemmatimonadaceae bacterium]